MNATLPRALFAAFLFLASLLAIPMSADASLYSESNTSGTSSYYISNYNGGTAERWSGQTFKLGSSYSGHYIKDIQVKMASTTSTGSICLFYGTVGSSSAGTWYATKCIGAGIGSTPVMVTFDFASPTYGSNTALAPNTGYEFYVYYTGTCTNCVRTMFSTSNVYRSSESYTKLAKEGTSFYYYPTEDLVFTVNTYHTPVVQTTGHEFFDDSSGVKVRFKGYTQDAGGQTPTMYAQVGSGSSGAYTTTYNNGQCSEGYFCWTDAWPYSQHSWYHYRVYGTNSAGTGYGSDVAFQTPNYAPNFPATPWGNYPYYAKPYTTYQFYTYASDPGDSALWFEMDATCESGGGSVDATSSTTFNHGATASVSYSYSTEGQKWFCMRARDVSGCTTVSSPVCLETQWSQWSGSVPLVIDGTAPGLTTISSSTHPSAATYYNNANPSFSWTSVTDSGGSGLNGYTYRLDTGSESSMTSSLSTSLTGVADGSHTFFVTAWDNSGNARVASYPFKVDVTAPQWAIPTASAPPAGQNNWYTSDVSLSIDSYDAGSGIYCEQHSPSASGTYVSGSSGSTTCSGQDAWTQSTEGGWTYYGRAEDNSQPTRKVIQGVNSLQFKMDKTQPTITGYVDRPWTHTNDPMQITFGDNKAGIASISYAIYPNANQVGTALQGWTQVWSATCDTGLTGTEGTKSRIEALVPNQSSYRQGENYVAARVVDCAGLQRTADVAHVQWDSVIPSKANPKADLVPLPNGDNGWYRSDIHLVVDSADDGGASNSGIAAEYWSDVGVTGPWTGGSANVEWTQAAEGTKTYFGRALDVAGNEAKSSGIPFKLDKTAPASSATIGPQPGPGDWYTSNVNVGVTATDGVSQVASVRTRVDSGSWTTTPGASVTVPVVGDGVHTVSYYGRDNAGNTDGSDAAPRTRQVKIDTTAPTTTADLDGTEGLAGWHVSPVDVTLTSTDGAGASGPAAIWYEVDDGGWTQVLQPTAAFTVSADGTHKVEYYSVDVAGNADGSQVAPHLVTFKVDQSAPVTTDSMTGTFSPSGWSSTPVSVTLLPTDAPSGVAETRYGLNVATTPTLYTGPFTVSNEGTTQLYYRTKDQAGNVEAVVSRTVRVDTLAPTFAAWSQSPASLDSSHAGPVSASVSVDAGPSGLGSAEFRYSYDDGFTWSSWAGTAPGLGTLRTFSIPAPAGGWWQYKEGALRYEVRATDGAGNTASQERTDALERVAPQVSILSPTVGASWGDTVRSIQWQGRDLDHDDVTYTVWWSSDGGSSYLLLDTKVVAETGGYQSHAFNVDTASLGDGANFAVKVQASDGLSTVVAVVTPFNVDNTNPTVGLVDPEERKLVVQGIEVTNDPLSQTRLVGVSTPLRATATDAGPGATGVERVRFFVDGALVGEDTTPDASGLYEVTWDTLLVPGAHTIAAISIDRAGNVSDEHSREVVVVSDAIPQV